MKGQTEIIIGITVAVVVLAAVMAAFNSAKPSGLQQTGLQDVNTPTVHVNEINEVPSTGTEQTGTGTITSSGTERNTNSPSYMGDSEAEETTDPDSEISGIEDDLGELNALLGE